jgi:leucyl/phenylalanyl-tRNA--protein transferase
MPVYRLTNELVFPPPSLAEPGGLLAVGGDLSPERLLLAYRSGIFPWYSEEDPILWWSPDPRLVLYPDELHVSRTLARTIRKGIYEVTIDREFRTVITSCAQIRGKNRDATWITDDMVDAYVELYNLGYAHSWEVRFDGKIVGGLYGISLGHCFFGESMFSAMPNASKVALVHMRNFLVEYGFDFVDCQLPTQHLIGMGARQIERDHFLQQLKRSLKNPTVVGPWKSDARHAHTGMNFST